MQYLKIPLERIGVLIGEHGRIKREIEECTNSKIGIEDTSVTVESTVPDCLGEMTAKNIIQAIGRGFNPEVAMQLLKEDYTLEVIPLSDYVGAGAFERIKGRIIGQSGKSRRVIEELSGASVSVYGKTVGIIGSFDDVALAKDAVVMLIQGARHSSVYRMLERVQSQRKTAHWDVAGLGERSVPDCAEATEELADDEEE
jgi:ribosomal RNA assembly protein